MRKSLWTGAVLLAAGALAAFHFLGRTGRSRPVPPAPLRDRDNTPPAPAIAEPSQRETMQFSQEGLAAAIAVQVERVAGPNRSRIAVRQAPDGPQWACVLVDSPECHYELDEGWRPEDLPFLANAGFQPPPPALSRTMSIYRSVTKTAMRYQRERGDRIIVLFCPKSQWGQVPFSWPPVGQP